MFGEEALDLLVAGVLQAVGQLVVGQVGFQRIIGERLAIAHVRAAVALAQGLPGLVVHLALLAEGGGVGRFHGGQAEEQAGNQGNETTAHGTSGQVNYEDAGYQRQLG
ncbi:hypothetical protein D3C76_1047180 [compost metagenome]